MERNFGGLGKGFLDKKSGDKTRSGDQRQEGSSTPGESSTRTDRTRRDSEGWQGSKERLQETWKKAQADQKDLENELQEVYSNLNESGKQGVATNINMRINAFAGVS